MRLPVNMIRTVPMEFYQAKYSLEKKEKSLKKLTKELNQQAHVVRLMFREKCNNKALVEATKDHYNELYYRHEALTLEIVQLRSLVDRLRDEPEPLTLEERVAALEEIVEQLMNK